MSHLLMNRMSNRCATPPARRALRLVGCGLLLVTTVGTAGAQDRVGTEERLSADPQVRPAPSTKGGDATRFSTTVRFLGGAALALGAHESAHVISDVAFGATPTFRAVDFHGIPFFAIVPEGELTRRQRFTISSAGFWIQHAGSEWILTRTPSLREQRAPLRKGMLAFNVLASAAYAGAALARTGPGERDTLGIADGAHMDERLVGTLLLAPAVFDTVRYYRPDATWAVWASRAVKIGMLLLVFR